MPPAAKKATTPRKRGPVAPPPAPVVFQEEAPVTEVENTEETPKAKRGRKPNPVAHAHSRFEKAKVRHGKALAKAAKVQSVQDELTAAAEELDAARAEYRAVVEATFDVEETDVEDSE